MADFLRIDFDSTRVEQALDRIGETAVAIVRPAAQAGAQVLYEEVVERAPKSEKAHIFHGKTKKYLFMPGTLRRSIYQAFSADRSSDTRATYHISWNHKKVPYGYMVERGTSRAPAHPFVRPAFDAARQRALEVANDKLVKSLREVLP
jgi:HK97 gp10 family phage protein